MQNILGFPQKIKTHARLVYIHESRKLKQARPKGQDVDLLRKTALTTPSSRTSIAQRIRFVKRAFKRFFVVLSYGFKLPRDLMPKTEQNSPHGEYN